MDGTTLAVGKTQHQCNPGWESVNGYMKSLDIPPLGTVWRCKCGKLWEVKRQPYANVFPNVRWYPAGRVTRWRYRKK